MFDSPRHRRDICTLAARVPRYSTGFTPAIQAARLFCAIEDTDAARNSQEAVAVILDGLRWLGLDWDEGPITADATGPSKGDCGLYFQSQRKEKYQRRVEALLSRGLAYEHEGAVKFKMQREPVIINDLAVGEVVRKLTDREEVDPDFVILRSDGQPVFHLVNVVDDIEMNITHVIRGEDHLSNTAKHIALVPRLWRAARRIMPISRSSLMRTVPK